MARTRAFRRHHRARMINRAFNSTRLRWMFEDEPDRLKEISTLVHDYLATCSCFMCGNQRHNDWQPTKERLTMQERKRYNALSEGLEEFYCYGYRTAPTNDDDGLV